MAAQVAVFEFIAISEIDTELCELGYSEADIWAIKWLIRNILLTSFLFYRLHRHGYIFLEPVLKWTLMGMALIAAWLPCLKAYPAVSVVLICLNTFLFAIGPLSSLPILFSRMFDLPGNMNNFLFVDRTLFTFYQLYNNTSKVLGYEQVHSMHQLRCYHAVLIYAWIVYQIARRENGRRQVGGAQEEAMDAIRHLH